VNREEKRREGKKRGRRMREEGREGPPMRICSKEGSKHDG